ncbi:MAG TPA: PilN domain-containing protein [Terriglobia bacterium]|nr:PilN domain-containing protein [Terriglobia bacterium]
MIRVNLSGAPKRKGGIKAAEVSSVSAGPSRAIPLLLILIVVGTAAAGWFWYSRLMGQLDDVNKQLVLEQAERDKLALVIKQDKVYEARKKALEARITVIEGLKRGQVSPVRSLDILDDAIDKTQYVWLSSLDQNNAMISMTGTGTSVNAIADFYTNLKATGYFRNINLQNATDAAGNYTFNLTCEFALPATPSKEAN